MRPKTRLRLLLTCVVPLAISVGSSEAAITNGLAGHWTFNESTGAVAADSSGNGNDAQVLNLIGDTPTWSAGKIGNALLFRGEANGGDYAIIPEFPRAANTFSVSAWALADPRETWPQSAIVENGLGTGGPIGLAIRNKNVDQAFGPLGETTSTTTGVIAIQDTVGFPTASWQHVGAVADGTQVKLYRNGSVVATASYSGTLAAAASPALAIGAMLDESGSPWTSFWQGMIDDVAVWTNALTDAEMTAIFAAGEAQKDLSHADEYLVSPPNISTQPKDLTRFTGEAAVFRVVSAGTAPFSYQWKFNDEPITGQTNATLTLPFVQASDAGAYSVAVKNGAGTANSTAATLTVTPIDLSTGLIGYWPMDETTGDLAADQSPGNHPATLVGFEDDSRWVSGRVGGALQLNGTVGQFGYVSEYAKPTNTMTAGAWVWADSRGAWATFLKNWGDASAGQFHFGLFSDGSLNIFIRQADGRTPNVSEPLIFPTNSWQHVAFVCDGSSLRLYRNGAEVASVPYDGTLGTSPMNCIGVGSKLADSCETPAASATGPWQGKLDEMAIWARGLSSQEIHAIFKAGAAGKGALQAGDELQTEPLITRQPVGATVFENVIVNLSASATGAGPLTYQWYKNGEILTGSNTPALNLGRVALSAAGQYQLKVTNSAGSAQTEEVTVMVNVRPPATLVSEWKFENNLLDTSGHGNDGTAMGEVQYIPGKVGTAIRLAPASPVVKEGALQLPAGRTNSWSINLWVNLTDLPTSLAYVAGFGPVLNVGAGTARGLIAFGGPGSNNILFWGNGNDQGSSIRYPTNRWGMVTVTYAADERTVRLYLDGAQIALGVRNLADLPEDAHRISLAPTSNWEIDLGGDFDEFSIWDGMLLPSQISALFDPNAVPVELNAQRTGSKLMLSWPGTAQGYILESRESLSGGSWSSVSGAVNNQIEIDYTGTHRFFRLRK